MVVILAYNISADYQYFSDRSVSLWRIFLSRNQIVNQVNIFCRTSNSAL